MVLPTKCSRFMFCWRRQIIPSGDLVEANKIGRNTHFHNVKRPNYKFPAKNIGTILEKVHKKLSNVREHRRRKI